MLFIPVLAVLVALSLGKPENYRLLKWTQFLYLPSALLLLGLTNGLHQRVFLFPNGVLSDDHYRYGGGCYAALAWMVLVRQCMTDSPKAAAVACLDYRDAAEQDGDLTDWLWTNVPGLMEKMAFLQSIPSDRVLNDGGSDPNYAGTAKLSYYAINMQATGATQQRNPVTAQRTDFSRTLRCSFFAFPSRSIPSRPDGSLFA